MESRPLDRREIGEASRLLARAFADDPFIGYFFADHRRRRIALPLFFRSILEQLVDAGAVFATKRGGTIVGVAAWSPPDARPPRVQARARARADALLVRLVFPRTAPRLLGGFDALGRHHPTEPHWYLAFVGIEPRLQGKGLGRELLTPVLTSADQGSRACYLETPFPATLEFYRRLGFDVTEQLRPVNGAPPVWTMTRPASSKAE